MPRMNTILANSDGWSWKPASSNQAWAPLDSEPSGEITSTSRVRAPMAMGMAQSR